MPFSQGWSCTSLIVFINSYLKHSMSEGNFTPGGGDLYPKPFSAYPDGWLTCLGGDHGLGGSQI